MSETSVDIWGEPTTNEADVVTDDDFKVEDTGESEETTEENGADDEGKNSVNGEPSDDETSKGEGESDKGADEEFKITYHGEETTLTRDEVIRNAQKGLDYDRLKQERDDYKESLGVLKQLAKENGMQVKEYLAEVKRNVDNAKIEGIAGKLIENGADEETAHKMAKLQFERDEANNRLRGIENARAEQDDLQARAQKMYNADVARLKEKGVEVNDELLISLKEYIDSGLTLVEAYKEKEIADLKKQLEAKQLHEESKQRSAGSTKSQKAIKTDDDLVKVFMDA